MQVNPTLEALLFVFISFCTLLMIQVFIVLPENIDFKVSVNVHSSLSQIHGSSHPICRELLEELGVTLAFMHGPVFGLLKLTKLNPLGIRSVSVKLVTGVEVRFFTFSSNTTSCQLVQDPIIDFISSRSVSLGLIVLIVSASQLFQILISQGTSTHPVFI
jgi:hypothetical protein